MTSWILAKGGETIEIPTIWFEERGRIYLGILDDPDGLRMTNRRIDDASMSRGGALEKQVSGSLYLDRGKLDSALSEIGQTARSTTENTRGRYPKSRSQKKTILELFDVMAEGKQFTYKRGELTNLAKEIADGHRVECGFDYVRRLIGPDYKEMKRKECG